MSEIEKMYENCNIKPKQEGYCDWDSNCPYPRLKCNDECPYWKDEDEAKYPPFTAEKQIELIKFITTLGVCEIENWNDKGFHFAIKRERIYPTMFLSLSNINLQETLADVINNLWQDLTKDEKQQVKGILE